MTDKNSSLSALKFQADNIARIIKATERGEIPDIKFAEKLKVARKEPTVKIGVVMDDKTLIIEVSWTIIHDYGEVALAAFILREMRETRIN